VFAGHGFVIGEDGRFFMFAIAGRRTQAEDIAA
jgi:hypothetical protein